MKEESWHFIGMGGIGMSGLARLLLHDDISVSGSDQKVGGILEELQAMGADVYQGHSAENIQPGMHVVYSTSIQHNNPEIEAAKRWQCRLWHRSDLLAYLMQPYRSLCVAGTHGKTTTSALLTHVLRYGGFDPSFAIGGILLGEQTNAGKGRGEYFVAEADESDGSFTKYFPWGAIVTNIGDDHLAHYGSLEAIESAFVQFFAKIENASLCFWCGDDPVLQRITPPGTSYGFSQECDVRIHIVHQEGWVTYFTLLDEKKNEVSLEIPLPGRHNVTHATAVYMMATRLGLPREIVVEALSTFPGVARRCERKRETKSVLIIDDYAHHPREIRATLTALRLALPYQRLVVLCQPHRYSRVRDTWKEWGRAFDPADHLLLMDIYSAGEEPIRGIDSAAIAKEVAGASTLPLSLTSRESAVVDVLAMLQRHDVIVCLGAGDITLIADKLCNALSEWIPPKQRIGIVCGGRSAEHEVSLVSARFVAQNIDSTLYDVDFFGIDSKGKWMSDANLLVGTRIPHQEREEVIPSSILKQLEACDVLLPILHGPFGEDGVIQGFFDLLGKPYLGSGVDASAIAMHKIFAKGIAQVAGIPTLPFLSITLEGWWREERRFLDRIEEALIYPLFVKPVRMGSSLGIQKVDSRQALAQALHEAFSYDSLVLVEQGVRARELEFAVLGDEVPTVFSPGEILAQGRVYDYEAKYGKEGFETTLTPRIPASIAKKGKEWAALLYGLFGCSGLARIDFLYDEEENALWFSEVNTLPGLTPISLYPQIASREGIPGPLLLDLWIQYALRKKRRLDRVHTRRIPQKLPS